MGGREEAGGDVIEMEAFEKKLGELMRNGTPRDPSSGEPGRERTITGVGPGKAKGRLIEEGDQFGLRRGQCRSIGGVMGGGSAGSAGWGGGF